MNARFSRSTSPAGETLNHIQALFFQNAKCGDRYWYEFPSAGFTKGNYGCLNETGHGAKTELLALDVTLRV